MKNTESLPVIYFLGANNVEKSPMAEALVNARHGNLLRAYSAGTHCKEGTERDPNCVAALAEKGIKLTGTATKVDEELFLNADAIIIVSRKMNVDPVPGMKGIITRWGVNEPSDEGITGRERANILRDYLIRRVDTLAVGIATNGGAVRSGVLGENIRD